MYCIAGSIRIKLDLNLSAIVMINVEIELNERILVYFALLYAI
jgi:hypothetical protein